MSIDSFFFALQITFGIKESVEKIRYQSSVSDTGDNCFSTISKSLLNISHSQHGQHKIIQFVPIQHEEI